MLSVKRTIFSLILIIAPVAMIQSASIFFWGEPEMPDSLKDL